MPQLILALEMCFRIMANELRSEKRHLRSLSKSAISAVLILLLLLEMGMAASETLHKLIHADADQPGHECSVTLFAHGQIESASVTIAPCIPTAGLEVTPQPIVSFYRPTMQSLPPGRGPPSLSLLS